MTRPALFRLILAVLLAWGGAAWWAAETPIPESPLVGARTPRPASQLATEFTQPDIAAASKRLEEVLLWGILRDGKPIPPPVKEEETRKKLEWRLVATALRPGEHYIMIQTPDQPPVTIKEGSLLPDGSKLLKVEPKSITLRLPNGKKHKQPTVFD